MIVLPLAPDAYIIIMRLSQIIIHSTATAIRHCLPHHQQASININGNVTLSPQHRHHACWIIAH
jgi:hypothetical protein